MKKYIYNLIIFTSCIFLIFYPLCKSYRTVRKSDYLDAIIDKHNNLKNTKSPRIILCGGSNLAFGIDSKRINDSIQLPVINMGLHAGLGLSFILKEIKPEINQSDIIIFSIENYLNIEGEYNLQKEASSNFPKANNYFKINLLEEIKNVRTEKLQENLQNNILYLFTPKQNQLNNLDTNSVWRRDAFNIYGDVVGHLNKPLPKNLNGRGKINYELWKGIKLLNEFAEFAKFKNIRVYFIFPCYPKSEFELNKVVIKKYENDLRRELEMPILNKPEDFVFADSLFYDTVYHLNKVGREKRTGLLIEILKKNHIGN